MLCATLRFFNNTQHGYIFTFIHQIKPIYLCGYNLSSQTDCANALLVLYLALVEFPALIKCDFVFKGFVTSVTLVPRLKHNFSLVLFILLKSLKRPTRYEQKLHICFDYRKSFSAKYFLLQFLSYIFGSCI